MASVSSAGVSRKRRKRTPQERAKLAHEALSRAVSSTSWSNYPAIFAGFEAMGIPTSNIIPRENVLTYHAWRAKGRQVKRGEHGVKVTSWYPLPDRKNPDNPDEKPAKRVRPVTAVVFHISQTKPIGG